MFEWLSKDKKKVNIPASKLQPPEVDTLYRIARRLQSRVTEVEAQAGNNRRDIARVEKRLQREALTELAPAEATESGQAAPSSMPIDSPYGRI